MGRLLGIANQERRGMSDAEIVDKLEPVFKQLVVQRDVDRRYTPQP